MHVNDSDNVWHLGLQNYLTDMLLVFNLGSRQLDFQLHTAFKDKPRLHSKPGLA